MLINKPSYIPIDRLSKYEITKDWDSDNPYENLGEVSDETVDRLSALSNRGILAYSIGCALWVIYRYADKTKINLLLEYVEACLPCLFGFSDRIPNELVQDEWVGAVRGPSQFSVFLVGDTWHSGEFGVPSKQGAYSENLALYDIPVICRERSLFLEWREKILNRLERDFQRISDAPDGLGVPLEILNPEINVEIGDHKTKILNAVSKLNKDNAFLKDLSDFNILSFPN